ncbi:MAG TPA: sugar phosphate isomerase/epimerase family protein [Clostridia bacterium]|nr:sugar phosphate isomerase/epimerase family protein [Clostridia bacterium]
MKTSTLTYRLMMKFGMEEAVRMLCEAGFDCIDQSFFTGQETKLVLEEDDYLERMHGLRKIAASYGVTFNQTHAPFPSFIEGNETYNQWAWKVLVKSIEASGILGAEYMVVHPFYVSKDKKKANMDFFGALLPIAQKHNVRLAIENMFAWDPVKETLVKNVCSDAEELGDYVDSLDSDFAVACLDVGHCGLVGESAPDMIRKLGHRLRSLHIHDNDNISDLHAIPFSGKIDFAGITDALREIGYKGEMTLETDRMLDGFPVELYPEVLRLLSRTARYLADSTGL